jgi:hypothetical protein
MSGVEARHPHLRRAGVDKHDVAPAQRGPGIGNHPMRGERKRESD